MIQEANERSWQEYWEEARRPGEWVDYIFIQVPGILCYTMRQIDFVRGPPKNFFFRIPWHILLLKINIFRLFGPPQKIFFYNPA